MSRHATIRLSIIPALALASCTSKPSYEAQVRAYNAAIQRAVADAAPAYALFTTIRANLATATPACTTAPPTGLVRISSNRLKALTGEPIDDNGWLVARTDPAPGAPDPHRLADPTDGGGAWDDDLVRDLPSPTQPVTYAGEPAEIRRRVAASAAAVTGAPGFLVQAVDQYRAPVLGDDTEFTAGAVQGRVIVFDRAGTPGCHYPYRAASSALISTTGANGGLLGALDRDLSVEMTKVIVAAFASS